MTIEATFYKKILFIGHSLIEFFDWQGRFPDHQVVSLGVAGETVEGLLARIDVIIKEYPDFDLVFIMTGTNNVAMEDFEFLASYKSIIEKLSTAYPKSGIFIHSILPVVLEWIKDEDIKRANSSIKKMADKTSAQFLDIYNFFVDNKGTAIKDYLLEDGVHLSDKGYAIWTGALDEIVNSNATHKGGNSEESPVHCPVCGRELTEKQRKKNGWECNCGEFIPEGLGIDSFMGSTDRIRPHYDKKRTGF